MRPAQIATCLVGLVFGACAEPRAAGPPPAQRTARAPQQSANGVVDAGSGAPSAAERGWVEAVRLERWTEAAAMLDALPASDRAPPELRFVRARVALELRDYARAAELLYDLQNQLPMLASQVARRRAEAALEVGPFEEAAAYFGGSSSVADLSRAAEAYAKAGEPVKARMAAGRAVAAAQLAKKTRDEAIARLSRARVLLAAGGASAPVAAGGASAPVAAGGASAPVAAGGASAPAAAAPALPDLKWIMKNAASSPEASEAARMIAALSPSRPAGTVAPASMQERLETVEAMVASGSAAEAIAELDRLVGAPGLPPAELHHRRATALYQARDYEAAASAFLKAAAAPSARQAEQLHLAARALARMSRDAEAVAKHLEVAAKHKRTRWGERSSFLAARLLMQLGRYKEAVAQYGRFIGAYPRSDLRPDAHYERALAQLSSGDALGARARLTELARRAPPDEAAKLVELAGLAALRAGDGEGAARLWMQVMRDQPMSWGALLSRSRLVSIGVAPPPLLGPAAPRRLEPLDVRLPAPAALLASMGLDRDAESYLAENEREATSRYAGREGEALCQMYGMLSPAKRRYRVGIQAVTLAALQRSPSEAERWAWECVYPAPYLDAVRALEAQHVLPKGLLHALMRQESAFDPVVVSPARAVGLLQLMPTTAEKAASELALGFELSELTSPQVNLKLGGFYMGKLLRMLDGSLPLATAAYNAGPKAVARWLVPGVERDTEVWVARIPYDETRNYVARVLSNLARYQWLDGADAAVALVPLEVPEGVTVPEDAY